MTPEQSEIVRRFMAGDSLTHIQHDFRHLSRGPGAAVDLTWVPVESALRAALVEKDERISVLEGDRFELECEEVRLERVIAEKERVIAEKERVIAEKDAVRRSFEEEVALLREQIKCDHREITAKDAEIERLRAREDTFERELMLIAGDDPKAREFAAKVILAGKESP